MDTIHKDLEKTLEIAVENLKQELIGIRSNRPSPQLLENIEVEYFGQMMSLKQLGTIGVVPPRELNITVWDSTTVETIAKALEEAPGNFNPQIDGSTIRMNMPPLTDERREELIRMVKSIAEEARIKVRTNRDDVNKKVDRAMSNKEISEDQKFNIKKKVQEVVDKMNKKIEELVANKTQELNE